MGFFDHLQKKGSGASIQVQKPQIRKVECKTTLVKSTSVPPRPGNSRSRPSTQTDKTRALTRAKSVGSPRDPPRPPKPKTKPTSRKRQSPEQKLYSSSDESDTDGSLDIRWAKKARISASAEPDLNRSIRDKNAFEEQDKRLSFVHAKDITSKLRPAGFKNAFEAEGEAPMATLQYPSATRREEYQLVVPREKDGFKPLDDIVHVVDVIAQNYIPEEHLQLFEDESTGLKRRFRRALAHGSLSKFKEVIHAYNKEIERLRRDGSISKHLDTKHALSLPLVERILTQVYSRTVSPRVESLRQYENGSDNVYGELLPRFISDIFKQTNLKSGQIFVDLGSGVGNVVLQAALEIGCESWGCEMMQNACDLAELQDAEFKARCRLWGIAPGETHLIRGDFLEIESIGKILRKADVVLINNQAFTPALNAKLVNYFLDMKEGCQIVSLKSFVPPGHRIQARNLNSPVNLLSVKQKNYWSDSVSWTDAGGSYFVATKDSSRLKAFSDKF